MNIVKNKNAYEHELLPLFKDSFLKAYSPVNNHSEATAFMSIDQIYDAFMTAFTNKTYADRLTQANDIESVEQWLHEHQFKLFEMKTFEFAWMLKRKDVKKQPIA